MKWGSRPALALILSAYAVLGTLYAVYTPPWQTPDEPAHYNYVRSIAEDGALPVMERGDYDQDYIWRLVEGHFPPDLPITPLTYEDHQPPLYYLLVAPVYLLFDGALLPLRLASVALGIGLLVIVFKVVRALFPTRPFLAVAATGLIAFLPQHTAMTAGVNNDTLAEVMVAIALMMAIRTVPSQPSGRALNPWALGFASGLAMLTKTTAYVALPVVLGAVVLRAWRERPSGSFLRSVAKDGGRVLLVAALLVGPWLARGIALYGPNDPLGLSRHNLVVEGQPRTADWLVQYGWAGLAQRFVRTTFQSFWGQFGWMTVPLHGPIYLALLLFTALVAAGFLGWLLDRGRPRLTLTQRDGLLLLTISALLTLALYLWYNLTFVQHQGRYLFPALIPLALATALGLEWLLTPQVARWVAVALGAVGLLMVLWGLAGGGLLLPPLAAAFGLGAIFALAACRLRLGPELTMAALGAGLVVLDIYALFGAIVPTLAR